MLHPSNGSVSTRSLAHAWISKSSVKYMTSLTSGKNEHGFSDSSKTNCLAVGYTELREISDRQVWLLFAVLTVILFNNSTNVFLNGIVNE